MGSFQGKVAAITGAASGMGRELAIELARRGCHVALADRNRAGLDETVALVRRAGDVRTTAQELDVSDRAAVFAWADQAAADHGKVNLVFNNAGVALAATIEAVRIEDFEWIVGINFWGVVYGTKAFLPHLRASGDGHVVNVSSVFGLIAAPMNGTYNATKFAVRGFTEALREELELEGAPVTATCIHPGGIQTAIAASARMDPSVQKVTGLSPAEATKDFEKSFITSAEKAAKIILKGVERRARRVLVGPDAVVIDLLQRLLPTSYQRVVVAATRRRRPRKT